MRLPKTITICGKTYEVKKDPELFGGKGSTGEQTITIGTLHGKDDHIFENLIHEVAECVMAHRGYRYQDSGEDGDAGLIFVMTHKEFDSAMVDVASALYPLVKD